MRIQLTTTHPDGKSDVVTQIYRPGETVQLLAVPGGKIAFEVDGQVLSGKTNIQGKPPVLLRRDDDLLVLIGEEPVVVVNAFFSTPEAGLQGNDWTLAQAGGEAVPAEDAEAAVQTSGQAAEAGNNGIYWALGAAGLVGAVAVAASSGGGSGSGSAAATVAALETTVNGTVVAGPVVAGHGLSVTLYKADGTALAGPVKVNDNGSFTISYDSRHSGPVVVKVVDGNAEADYLDEATGAGKDLAGDLRAVFVSGSQGAIDVVVSPMSELATRVMGLAPGVQQTGALTSAQINEANQNVAQSLGLTDGLFAPVIAVVDAAGKAVAAPNLAGLTLMALSGLEQLHGADAAMALLSQAVAAPEPSAMSSLLIAGSREAGLLSKLDYIGLWEQTAPASALAKAITEAKAVTDADIAAWTPEHAAALGLEVIAALSPEQIAQFSAPVARALTSAQLKVLDTASLSALMGAHALSETQALALSAQALTLVLGNPALTIRDDSAVPAADVAQQAGHAATLDSTPVLSGKLSFKLPDAAELVVYSGETRLGAVVVGADGGWSFTPAVALADGVYALQLRVVTKGGSSSSGSAPLSLTVDTTPPVAPGLQLEQDTGVPDDGISNSGSIRVSQLEPGAKWQYSIDGGTTWQDGAGTTFTVPAGSYAANALQVRQTDAVGHRSEVGANTAAIVVDSTAPTLQISSDVDRLNAGQTATLTFTFSEPPAAFALANILATHGSVTNMQPVAGSATSYTATFTPVADMAAATPAITVQGVTDVAGNALPSTVADSLIAMDTLAPALQITSSARQLHQGQTATIRFVFSETPAQALTADSITVHNGTLSALRRDADVDTIYTATFTPGPNLDHGTVATISVNANSYADVFGNQGQQADLVGALNIDTVSPTVRSVVITGTDAAGTLKATTLIPGDKVKVELTMSEASNISSSAVYDLTLGSALRQAIYVSGSGSTTLVFEYTVQAGDQVSANGITATQNALTLGQGGSWTDLLGNAGPSAVNAVVADANAITIDGAAPVFERFEVNALDASRTAKAANAPALLGEYLQFTAHFNEAVVVTGTPQFAFTLGDRSYQARYVSGSNSNALVFQYEVVTGDHGLRNALTVATDAISLPGSASIKDVWGNTATLNTFAASALSEATSLINGQQGTVQGIAIQSQTGAHNGWLGPTDTVTARVTFDQDVVATGTPQLQLQIGSQVVTANYAGPVSTAIRTMDFTYTIQQGQEAPSGIAIPANALILNGGSIRGGGNPVMLSSVAVAANAGYQVDGIPPAIEGMIIAGMDARNNPKEGALTGGDKVRLELWFSEDVEVPQFGENVRYLIDREEGGSQYFSARLVSVNGKLVTLEYVLREGERFEGNFSTTNGAFTGNSAVFDKSNNWLPNNSGIPAHCATGVMNIAGSVSPVYAISAQQIANLTTDRNYWVKLNPQAVVKGIDLGPINYGYWENAAGDVFHRQWTGEHGGRAVSLHAQGGKAGLEFAGASVQGSSITLALSDAAQQAVMQGGDWTLAGGSVTAVTASADNQTLTLTTASPVNGVLELSYTGSTLRNDAYAGLKYSHLRIGTDAAETIDGSAYVGGNQALFANGGGGAMIGGTGHDLLVAGAGNDMLTGGRGADTFKWGSAGGGRDVITDFVKTDGDRIDLRDALAAIQDRSVLDNFLRLAQGAGGSNDAILSVDVTGAGQFTNPGLVITVTDGWTSGGLSTALQTLVNQQVIMV